MLINAWLVVGSKSQPALQRTRTARVPLKSITQDRSPFQLIEVTLLAVCVHYFVWLDELFRGYVDMYHDDADVMYIDD